MNQVMQVPQQIKDKEHLQLIIADLEASLASAIAKKALQDKQYNINKEAAEKRIAELKQQLLDMP